jgi:hypothetical protein
MTINKKVLFSERFQCRQPYLLFDVKEAADGTNI